MRQEDTFICDCGESIKGFKDYRRHVQQSCSEADCPRVKTHLGMFFCLGCGKSYARADSRLRHHRNTSGHCQPLWKEDRDAQLQEWRAAYQASTEGFDGIDSEDEPGEDDEELYEHIRLSPLFSLGIDADGEQAGTGTIRTTSSKPPRPSLARLNMSTSRLNISSEC